MLLVFIQPYSLVGFQRNHRIYLIILCIKYLRNHDQIKNRSPGPLIKLSMKSSDYSRRRCVLDLLKITLPQNLYQELNFLMESSTTSLPVLPQSKLVENTTKYIQSKLDMDKLGQDWTCPQQFAKSLNPLRYYKSKSKYISI